MNTEPAPGASPMMLAYAVAQAVAPDHLVLYRVGEFYEVLGLSASTVSRALGIQMTRRRQKDADDVPMCGVPAGTSEQAIARLLAAGHKVAVSEQPLEPGGERPLRRLTPATSVAADVVPTGQTNNLTVAMAEGRIIAFAWTDLSTGESGTTTSSLEGCGPALARIAPAEILVARWPEQSDALAVAIRSSGVPSSRLPEADAPQNDPEAVLGQAYGNGWRDRLRGISPVELTALAILLGYVRASVGQLPDALSPPRRVLMGDTMQIDAPTLRGLEVLTSGSGREGSLLSVIDRTVTPAGARLLARQLAAPLTSPQQIGRRLAMVRSLVTNPQVRADCREDLGAMPDMLRACGRLSLGKGGPRDLAAIRDGLQRAAALTKRLQGTADLAPGLVSVARDLAAASEGTCAETAHSLRRALVPQPPAAVREPGYVVEGYSTQLDGARADNSRAREAIDELQARYVAETGVKTLRIKVNTLVGYHVEVPSSQARALGERLHLAPGSGIVHSLQHGRAGRAGSPARGRHRTRREGRAGGIHRPVERRDERARDHDPDRACVCGPGLGGWLGTGGRRGPVDRAGAGRRRSAGH